MPEGPEIHRAAQQLRNALEGSVITHVECPYTTIQGQEHRFLGNPVISIEARSKAMLIHIGEDVLYSHNQLYCRWTVQKNSTKPKKTNRSLRIKLQNETHTACLYSATDIQIIEPWEIEGHPYIAKLGPDVANRNVDFDGVLEQVKNPKFGRRQLSHILLDQAFLAGVGNYLRSEILHSARINPSRKLNTLSEVEQNNLAHSAIQVTQLAYEQRGVTVEKGLYDLLRENGMSRRQARHHVFTRDGLECHECKTTIVHTRLSGRRLDFCPSCQR
jgi:endonuclease-8